MSRKRVTLTVEVIFDGDYYELRELVDLSHDWISSAFEDRSDVGEMTVTGTATLIGPEARP